jgi:urease accessory protein
LNPWLASLDLSFERSPDPQNHRTLLGRRRHHGPLMVQRPFYEDNGTCQVYVLHPPGGVVGGDQLTLDCELQAGAHALLTTPAASKFYRSEQRECVQRQNFRVAPGATLEWLPQETILFDGSRLQSETRIELEPGAHFTGWEIVCLGRDERGFTQGTYSQRWRLLREQRVVWAERGAWTGGAEMLDAAWGLAGRRVLGTLVSTGSEPALVEAVRSAVQADGDDWFSVTALRDVLVARYLGYSAEIAKRLFAQVWALLRPGLSGRDAVCPRVWAT